MEGPTCSPCLGSSCNLFLRLEFNCIYIVELFAINCGPGLHMRCGVAVSQLEPAFYGIPSGPHASPKLDHY